jgi:hypothetical protein
VAARLAATPEIAERDGHALAGFLDAEAHFSIGRNNGGRNWRCSVSVRLRDDDAPVLAEFRRVTGVGTLVAVPARGGSKPQCEWKVTSGLECLRLADLLERFPMYGRKRLEVNDWIRAVRALETRDPDVDVADLARSIRDRRRYREPKADPHPPEDQPGLLWYLGGFFTGEGSFALSRQQARAVVKVRRDDRPLLAGFASITGLGKVYDIKPSGSQSPSAAWIVLRHGELRPAVELLEAAHLRGRKRRELRVWRGGAEEFADAHAAGRPRDGERIDVAAAALREVRRYAQRHPLPADELASTAESVYIGVLREWAAAEPGKLACTAYTRARRSKPHWPQRETLVRTFGSWAGALRAAGLAGRTTARSQRACSASIPTTAASTRRRSSVRCGSPERSMS